MTTTLGSSTTYFVNNYYELTNGVVTKYYYAGSQRIAMRSNGTTSYLLSDHLGSTALTTNIYGVVSSELRYSPWGEVRYQAGTSPTKYTYTGQYDNTADFGLMYYNARWYDPSLGRFAQADSIVPAGVQGYDRYAYGLNNPSRYTDPSGHCAICLFGRALVTLAVNVADATSHVFGWSPDTAGIAIAQEYVANKDALVGAGIAVQSQWYNPLWDSRKNPLASSYGIAQVTDDQMEKYKLTGDQEDPSTAVSAMNERIYQVVNLCNPCGASDKLIAAALAQNGGFDKRDMAGLINNSPNGIDWNAYFDARGKTGNSWLDTRAANHQGYDTRFMLYLYTQDLLTLNDQGWDLPFDLTRNDVIDIQDNYTYSDKR